MKIIGIIPARFGSTRFPGKPLININGKTMIQRVYEQALKAESLSDVVVATDNQRIYESIKSFGGSVTMTSKTHESGTSRCAEVVEKMDTIPDVVINIQGDEPFINPKQIDQLSNCFNDEETDIATLIKKIGSEQELFDRNRPKVEVDNNWFALRFSRDVIPNLPNTEKKNYLKEHTFFKHIGVYGYRTDVLKKIVQLPTSQIELEENLEQLRWLENNYAIKVALTEYESIAIDTKEDLKKITFL